MEEADLIHANPHYAHVRFKNGHEATVSLKDVAPVPNHDLPNSSTEKDGDHQPVEMVGESLVPNIEHSDQGEQELACDNS